MEDGGGCVGEICWLGIGAIVKAACRAAAGGGCEMAAKPWLHRGAGAGRRIWCFATLQALPSPCAPASHHIAAASAARHPGLGAILRRPERPTSASGSFCLRVQPLRAASSRAVYSFVRLGGYCLGPARNYPRAARVCSLQERE